MPEVVGNSICILRFDEVAEEEKVILSFYWFIYLYIYDEVYKYDFGGRRNAA